MIVGEQPGDQEDLLGSPFVGPAGLLLRTHMVRSGLSPDRAFITNAVKHFKHERQGKRRLHKTPNAGEIDACRPHLLAEVAAMRPEIIVALGTTALRALLNRPQRLGSIRGDVLQYGHSLLIPTFHPAYLLRLTDPQARRLEEQKFASDLALAAARLAKPQPGAISNR